MNYSTGHLCPLQDTNKYSIWVEVPIMNKQPSKLALMGLRQLVSSWVRGFYTGYVAFHRAPTVPTCTLGSTFETRTPATGAPIYYLALILVT